MKEKNSQKENILFKTIIETIKNKKGKEIVSIDLHKIENSVCDYFIICTGSSTTQINAIAEEIREKTIEIADTEVDHIEGLKNTNWILMDYLSIVAHIFLSDKRKFYQLEDLWADAIISKHEEI